MSDVNAQDKTMIGTADDVLHLYAGTDTPKIGAEVEMSFFNPDNLSFMGKDRNDAVRMDAGAHFEVGREPSPDMLEIASIAGSAGQLDLVIEDTIRKTQGLTEAAARHGLKRSWFEQQPQVAASDLLANIVDVPRYQAFFNPVREDMKDIARYFVLSKSVQNSVSYRDPEHLLRSLYRLYALAPFLFMLSDNSGAFLDNDPAPVDFHPGMVLRGALGPRGGVPELLYTAKTGQDYILGHIETVMNAPMFVYYDADGTLVRLPAGQFTSFNALKDRGLNTGANYYLSQSTLWPDVKIAALKDQDGTVFGHRFEARMFGTGLHQPQTSLLIVAALAFNDEFAARTDGLLKAYGFDPTDRDAFRAAIDFSYKSARCHRNRFFKTFYGNGQMIDFSKQFADLLEDAYSGSGLEDRLIPALHICRTGRSDGFVNRALFETLKDAAEFQRDFDPALFHEENSCADLALGKTLGRSMAALTVPLPCLGRSGCGQI